VSNGFAKIRLPGLAHEVCLYPYDPMVVFKFRMAAYASLRRIPTSVAVRQHGPSTVFAPWRRMVCTWMALKTDADRCQERRSPDVMMLVQMPGRTGMNNND